MTIFPRPMLHCVVLLVVLGASEVAHADVPIVYSRCPRTTDVVDMSGDVVVDGVTKRVTRRMRGFDTYDVLPEVRFFLSGFTAPCDLVYRDAAGAERVLYDCSSTSTEEAACAAIDPAVSHDGKTIAFAVFRGSLGPYREGVNARVLDPNANNAPAQNVVPEYFPNRRLGATEAQLHLVDVASGAVTPLPGLEGEFDSGPAFLPNGRLIFSSTRERHHVTLVWGTGDNGRGSRLWTMDLDGRNLDIASHHSLAQEQHPHVLRDGRVAYSSWQVFGGLPFRHTNGSIGGFTTLANLFHIFTQAPDGAGQFAFYGQHSGDHAKSYFGASHTAAHFLTQTSDGRVWISDYYRGNNMGLGVIVGVMPEPEGQEGLGPGEIDRHADIFAPRDAIRLSTWATNGDAVSKLITPSTLMHPHYADPLPFAGKLGHPAALPDNGLMVAWGVGPCSTVTGNGVFAALGMTAPPHTSGSGQSTGINLITSLGIDTPGCDVGIYRVTVIPSQHPRDLELVVDAPEWHEIMARAVVPYSEIFGVEHPDVILRADKQVSRSELEVGTPFGLLGAASITDRETHPWRGIHFAGELQFNSQGTDTINYGDDELCGVRILGPMPNRSRTVWREIANVAGERIAILGEVSVRNRDATGAPVLTSEGAPDTSFLLRMPANAPYLMQGIDCQGRTLNTDQTWQHLRPGEQKTCGGCHVHSRPPLHEFEESFAATRDYEIARLGEGQVPLLMGETGSGDVATRMVAGYGMRIDFQRDIMPIFMERCASCHGGDAPAASLALDRPGIDGLRAVPAGVAVTDTPSTWWCLVADRGQECIPEARQFQTGWRDNKFRRPQLTRYVRALNSRGSLLYWKAANQRTDGNTDDTFTDDSPANDRDIDFGADHPTEITPEELGLLSRWIDIGCPGGAEELADTQRPTLHLAAIVDGQTVTELRIGTVDVGSGIAPETLTVCILGLDGACDDISGDAQMHGVTAILLPGGLSDPDTEILARVQDVAGNETEVRRTVRWLLDSPPPPIGGGEDAGDGSGSGGGGGGGGGGEASRLSGGCGCQAASLPNSLGSLGVLALTLGAVLRRRRRLRRPQRDEGVRPGRR